MTDALLWPCVVCRELRPDTFITVAKRKIMIDRAADPLEVNLCYCNDRARCFREMPRLLDEASRPFIDNMIASRVHLLWNGLAICDAHKRWPEDFPEGSKWIGLSAIHENEALFGEVTCAPCKKAGASYVKTRPDGRP